MLCFDFIGVINQVNVLFFTHIFKVCIYLLTFLTKFLVVSSQDDVWYDDITIFAFHMKDYMIRVFSQRRFYVILYATCCCVWKMLDKNLAVTLNFFFDISQPFTCLSILSPNITINFWLFELMSQLLIDELSSLLSAFSLVDALSAFFCNGVDCFRSMCVIFLFSFFTLSLSVQLGFFWQWQASFLPRTFSFTYCFSVYQYKRLLKIYLEISFSSELLTNCNCN